MAKLGSVYFAAVLILASLSLIVLQIFFFPSVKACIFSQQSSVGASLSVSSALISAAVGCAKTPGLALFAFPALFFLSLLSRPFFSRLSGVLASILASGKKSVAFLIFFLAIATSFYLAPGDILVGDAGSFQATAYSYSRSFQQGALPSVSFDWYGGSMHFYYYGILYFVVAGLANLVFHDVNLVSKLLLWLFHVGSGVAFYFIAMRFTKNCAAAVFAALLYALAFEHVAKVIIIGRFTDAFIYLLLPLVVLVFERLLLSEAAAWRGSALLALLLSAVFLTSPADSVYVFALFGLYALARLLQLRSVRPLAPLTLSCILFLLLTAFWIVPFFLESEYVNGTARVLNEIKPAPDFATLGKLFSWPGFWGQSRAYYISLTAVAFSLLAAYLVVRRKLHPLSSAVFKAAFLPVVAALALAVLFSGRSGSGLVFFLCLAAAFGLGYALSKPVFLSLPQKAFAVLLFLVILVDVLPAIVQPAYADFSYEKSFLDESLPKASPEGFARLLDLHTNYRTYYPYVPYITTGLPVVFGPLPEGAPRSFPYFAAISNLAAHEVYDENTTLSSTSINGLYLLGVGYVVLHGEQVGVDPAVSFSSKRYPFGLERSLSVLVLNSSPVMVSKNIVQVPSHHPIEDDESFFTKQKFNLRQMDWTYTSDLIDRMNISLGSNSAGVIFVKKAGNATIESEGRPSVRLLAFRTSTSKATMVVSSSSDAFARLAYSYYPWLTVTVNGKKAEPIETAMNFIAVPIGRGESTIVVEGTLSAVHKIFGLLSAVSLLVCLLLIVRSRR